MAENEALLTGGRKAVATFEDLAVGPAPPQRQGAHQTRAVRLRWFGDLLEPRRVGGAGRNGDCAHPLPLDCLGFGSRRALSPRSAVKLSAFPRVTMLRLPGKKPLASLRRKQKKNPAAGNENTAGPVINFNWKNADGALSALEGAVR